MAETTAPADSAGAATDQAADDAAAAPQPCSACRATGRVFANRGGEQISVACPWCQGSGQWVAGYDAQAESSHPAA